MRGILTRTVFIGNVPIGDGSPLCVIAGPCVIEDEETTIAAAIKLKAIAEDAGVPIVFKSSYDKANRTSINSYRGPGIVKGLEILRRIKDEVSLSVLSDVHSVDEIRLAANVLDAIQIPAFLCRQTDLIVAAARTGMPVNIKKGQFLAPWAVKNIIEKFTSTGNHNLLITERGTSFGYNNLVVDFRAIPIIQGYGYPVVFDATHSLQLPGGLGSASGGQREFAEPLARAAVAVGVDAIFMETHECPEKALCDGPNMLRLDDVKGLLHELKRIREAVIPDENGNKIL